MAKSLAVGVWSKANNVTLFRRFRLRHGIRELKFVGDIDTI
ncbi:MAG: hypothetical protein WBO23_09345 [Burkholderiales bacterium]